MKSITIHGLDETLDRLIRKRAKKHGKSLNKTIKKLLEEALGIDKKPPSGNRDDFLDLFGIWTAREVKQFMTTTKDLEKVDREDWK
jgi:hypothetical protein